MTADRRASRLTIPLLRPAHHARQRGHKRGLKRKFIFAASSLAFAPASAWAQSNVTLYGLVESDLSYVSNVQTSATGGAGGAPKGKSIFAINDGGAGAGVQSRWGIKGEEDLGAGRKVIFQLESGLNIDNGALGGNTLFGRLSEVGFRQSGLGTLTLGRQYDAVGDFVWPLTFKSFGGNFTIHPADYDNMNAKDYNNTVKYVSENYGRFRFGGSYSFGSASGSYTQARAWSLGGAYANGPLSIGGAIFNASDPNVSLYGTLAANPAANTLGSAGSAVGPASNPIIAGFASARVQRTEMVAATYKLGDALLGAAYSTTAFEGLGGFGGAALNPLGYSGSVRLNTVNASLRYQLTAAWATGIGLDYTSGGKTNGLGGQKYAQLSWVTTYAFSKATFIYFSAAFQRAGGTNSLGQPAVAQIGYLSPSASNRQSAFAIGLAHWF